MRRKNKSAAYGYYGGVTNSNYYRPSTDTEFYPLPPLAQFTEADKQRLLQVVQAADFVNKNAPNILLRVATEELSGNVDTFVMTTSGNPDDKIVYTTNKDEIVLDDMAGEGIISNSNDAVDGGFF